MFIDCAAICRRRPADKNTTIDWFLVKTSKHKRRAQVTSTISVPTGPLVRRLLLHLHAISHGFFDLPARVDPFTRPGAVVSWVTAGRGTLRLDDQEWRFEPGPCWLYGTQHKRVFVPDPGQRIILNSFRFSGPGLEGWLEELDVRRQPAFVIRHPQRIYDAFDRMRKLSQQRPPNWELSVHLALTGVLGEFLLSRGLLASGRGGLPPAIAGVLNAIESDPARNWKVAQLAGMANMSVSAFRILFRKTVGNAPHAHLQQARLDLARGMLADRNLRIKEIAAKLHFSSEYYFSSFFRKHAGLSPTQFRQVLLSTPGPI